jgi:CelD/BcsL family acetyltransferase involved in cellulose biosynthesis
MSEKGITIKEILDAESFFALKNTWNELLQKSQANNIFLTWEWTYTWWEHYREGKDLFILVAEEDGKIIGLAPLCSRRSRFFSIRSLNHIEFIGSTGTSSEYLDFIAFEGRDKDVTYGFLDYIYSSGKLKWVLLNLVSIRSDSITLRLIKQYLGEKGIEYSIYHERVSPYVDLPSSVEQYYESIMGKRIKRINTYRRKLFREFDVSIERVEKADNLNSNFELFTTLHQKRWNSKGGLGSFVSTREKYRLFHDKIIQLFFDKNWLYLTFLRVNGEPVAAQYNFLFCNKMYYYSTGFDPLWEKYRVGLIFQMMILEKAIMMGLSEFDFLRGTEEYKNYWAKKEHESIDMVIWRSKFKFYQAKLEKKFRTVVNRVIPYRIGIRLYERIFSRIEEEGD